MRRTVVSSYPIAVVIGNHRWRPGVNIVGQPEWDRVHWESVEKDQRLKELERPVPKITREAVFITLPAPALQ